jgi:hypothetical protein
MNDDVRWWTAPLIFFVVFFGFCALGYWLKVL